MSREDFIEEYGLQPRRDDPAEKERELTLSEKKLAEFRKHLAEEEAKEEARLAIRKENTVETNGSPGRLHPAHKDLKANRGPRRADVQRGFPGMDPPQGWDDRGSRVTWHGRR
jgi:hypothetical protein